MHRCAAHREQQAATMQRAAAEENATGSDRGKTQRAVVEAKHNEQQTAAGLQHII